MHIRWTLSLTVALLSAALLSSTLFGSFAHAQGPDDESDKLYALLQEYYDGEMTEADERRLHSRLRSLRGVRGPTAIPTGLLPSDTFDYSGQLVPCGGESMPGLTFDQIHTHHQAWVCNTRTNEWVLVQRPPPDLTPYHLFAVIAQGMQDPQNPNICDPKVTVTIPATSSAKYAGQTFTVENLNYDGRACAERRYLEGWNQYRAEKGLEPLDERP